jgi:hypothetical protein
MPSGKFAGNSISAFSVGLENLTLDQPMYKFKNVPPDRDHG